MGSRQEAKLPKFGKIYSNSAKSKKVAKSNGKKNTKTPTRRERAMKGERAVAEDEKDNNDSELEVQAQSDADIIRSKAEESDRTVERRISLPTLPENRPASQKSETESRTGKEEALSLPMINTRSDLISQSLNTCGNDDASGKCDDKTEPDASHGGRSSEQENDTEDAKKDDKAEQSSMMQKSNIFQRSVAKLRDKSDSQAQIDFKILEKLLNKEEPESDREVKKSKRFKRAAKASRKAVMFSNFLMQDLNLRYLQAVYDDPDYNDKYARIRTPDLETDEEKDDELLQEMHEDYSTSEKQSDSELGNDDSSLSTESESERNESDSDAGSPFKIPEEIKELIEKEQAEKDDDLRELGIWKEEENVADDEKERSESEDADDEKSEDDWSMKTSEGEDDSEDEMAKKKDKETNRVIEVVEKPSKAPLPAYRIALPVGDTPDILLSSGEESVRTIYASQLDEYESDIFGSRFQHGMFYLPPSQKSDAGDSDMFYCVPSVAVSYYPTRDYLIMRKGATGKRPEKLKKKRRRKELNEQFLRSAMKKHAVQDTSIAKYGNATKAFRLRMAKLGKDPKETDDKINAKIERNLRKRLKRTPNKSDELTKNNVKRLPNLSKKAKIMRWVKLYDKNGLIKTFYENGWVENSGGSLQPTTDRAADGGQDPKHVAMNRAETIENETVSNETDEYKKGEEKDVSYKQRQNSLVEDNLESQDKKNCNRKRIKPKHRRRRISDSMKKRKQEKSGSSSEESFVISKDWQISIGRSKTFVDNEEDEDEEDEEEFPKSDHSQSKREEDSNSDEQASGYISSNQSEAIMDTRFATPDTEPELLEKQEPVRPEKPKKKHSVGSRWGLVPNLIMSKKRNTLNNELADVTRLLFEQLSLKTKEYSKLPPIKRRSGVTSKVSSRSSREDRSRSAINTSRHSQGIALETP